MRYKLYYKRSNLYFYNQLFLNKAKENDLFLKRQD